MAQKKKQFDTYITLRFDATKADVLRAISWESNMRDGEAFAEFLVDALIARTGYTCD